MNRIFSFALGAVITLAAVLSYDYWSNNKDNFKEEVTIRLKWAHQAQFAGFYVAKEHQLYGVNTILQPGGSDFPAIKMVVSGGEQFGVTGADQILLARSNGVPVVPLVVIYRENPFVLFTRSVKTIKDLKSFEGLRVGVKLGGNEELIYRAMMKNARVDTRKLTEVPIKFDMTPFFAGAVDVWPGYAINEPLVAESKGIPVDIFKPSTVGVNLYADTLFTTEEFLRTKPGVVADIVRGTIEGWEYALSHVDEGAKLSLQMAPQSGFDHQQKMLLASTTLVDPNNTGVGYMTKAGWEQTQEVLLQGGFLKQKVDIEKMLDLAKQGHAIVK